MSTALGTQVDCSHSMILHERTPSQYRRDPYIIEGAGHENVVDHDIEGYFERVSPTLYTPRPMPMPHASCPCPMPMSTCR